MNTHRFSNPGTVTQYEISGMKSDDAPRRIRWQYAWCSVSERQHVRSMEEWIALRHRTDDELGD